ncbi:MAG TPA: alkaline phosphatase family protein, partial [Candidatus Acidoferrales bacterium]|nr:alkaline phosphatase family protein [Candidatus Acidoferrales bacterium]
MRNSVVPFFLCCLVLIAASCGTGPQTGSTSKSGGSGGGGGGGGGGTPSGSINSVNHIVIMMQENRSFDHYFGHLGAYRAAQGAGQASDIDGTPANVSLKTWDGTPSVSPMHMITMCTVDLTSNWLESHYTIDLEHPTNVTNNPPMDGAANMQGGYCAHSGCFDTSGARAMGYYTESDLPFYYWAATQFATSNRWFSAAPARTQINRMYLLAATSQGHVEPNDGWNITAKTIFEELQDANVTWKVYVTDWSASSPAAGSYMNYFGNFTPKYLDHFVDATTFAKDAAAGTLPQVSLIESGYESSSSDTGSEVDEHPQANVQVGSNYVRSMVTALMNGPNWKDSVFFLTYDEFGGFYDHVPPMQTVNPDGIAPIDIPAGAPSGDFTITGLRVPLIVISPFTKPHFVSNTQADFTAFLKFI